MSAMDTVHHLHEAGMAGWYASSFTVPFPCHVVVDLQAEGARAIAKGLAANATLAKLSLAWNGLEEGE